MDGDGASEDIDGIAAAVDAARADEGGETRSVLAGCVGQIVTALAGAAVAFGLLSSASSGAQTATFVALLALGQLIATAAIAATVLKSRLLGLVLALLPILVIGSLAAIVGTEGGRFEDRWWVVLVPLWGVALGVTVVGWMLGRRLRWRRHAPIKRRARTTADQRLGRASSDWRRAEFIVRYDDTDAGRLERELDAQLAAARGYAVAGTRPHGPSRLDSILQLGLALASLFQGGNASWSGDEPSVDVTYERTGRPLAR
jgi:hypothetical protein